jgi:hypothetical protein
MLRYSWQGRMFQCSLFVIPPFARSSDEVSSKDGNVMRYAWGISRDNDQIREILVDIAQRLEAVVCNEAVTERTNSAMKRLFSPFRLRMQSDVLLSRLTIARHGSVEPRKSSGSESTADRVHESAEMGPVHQMLASRSFISF